MNLLTQQYSVKKEWRKMMLKTVEKEVTYLGKKEYKKALKKCQLKMLELQRELHRKKIPVVVMFEGWDAAGKGGVIRRLTEGLEPRGYQVHSIAAPDDHEKQYHYLRRFWKALPIRGHMCIFDRSWYGRVLVERVEGFAKEKEWKRAYEEINAVEEMLAKDGHIILKFWLHISKEEQLRRFEERKNNPLKQWKLTDEDWRNREKWDQYEEAVCDMVDRTHTEMAPWHIIQGNDKKTARIKVMETIISAMEAKISNLA